LLRLGSDADVVDPQTVRDEVRAQARATLARYQG
jgi:predicted DNA-binding transcriptional regulator YafY